MRTSTVLDGPSSRRKDDRATGREAPDRLLWGGVALAVALGAVLRTVHLGAGLPGLAYPDEGPIVDLALGVLDGDVAPSDVGWPPASIHLTAAVIAAGRGLGLALPAGSTSIFLVTRSLFVVVSLVAVALAGLLGALLADDCGRRRPVAWGAALAMAVSYLGVRLGRQVHPDHLQAVLVAASFACALRFDRARRWRWLVAAGGLAGLAGAAKYLGILVVVPAAMAVLVPPPGAPRTRRAAHGLGLLAGSAGVGFLAGSPGLLLDPARFWQGVTFQARRQATGHLGYEPEGTGWGFHLTQSLPGTWGWALTALALVGTLWVVRRGTRAQRLASSFVVPVLAVVGALQARFPHYVLVLLPFLAALGFIAVTRLGAAAGTRAPVLAGRAPAFAAGVLALSLVPTLTHDVRLLRAATAPETRLLAAPIVVSQPAPVWVEPYVLAGAAPPGVLVVPSLGTTPQAMSCDCTVVISSYMEDRYRRRPDLYREEVAVYDAVRDRGRLIAVVGPDPPLSYRWDVLPQWGLDRLPLRGPVGAVGPTLTVLDLRGSRGA